LAELQPEIAKMPAISKTRSIPARVSLRWMRCVEKAKHTIPPQARKARDIPGGRSVALDGAIVERVRVLVAGTPLVKASEGALKLQVSSLGSVPQERVTVPVKPSAGVTVMGNIACWPGWMVALVEVAETAKVGAAIVTVTELDVLAGA